MFFRRRCRNFTIQIFIWYLGADFTISMACLLLCRHSNAWVVRFNFKVVSFANRIFASNASNRIGAKKRQLGGFDLNPHYTTTATTLQNEWKFDERKKKPNNSKSIVDYLFWHITFHRPFQCSLECVCDMEIVRKARSTWFYWQFWCLWLWITMSDALSLSHFRSHSKAQLLLSACICPIEANPSFVAHTHTH